MVNIISRAEWGAAPPADPPATTPIGERSGVMAHYTTGQELGREDTAAWVKEIQRYHQYGNGWDDIGYNYLIDREGRIFEGRGRDVIGAHAKGANTAYVGVAFLGNDDKGVQDVTPAARASFAALYEWLRKAAKKSAKSFARKGHRDVNDTQCPGDELYGWWTADTLDVDDTAAPSKPSTSTGKRWPSGWTLKRGSRNSRVGLLQQGLMAVFPLYARNIGDTRGRPDNSYGPKTEAAVREFQRRAGIEVDGRVGPETHRTLRRYGINLPMPKGW